MPQISKQTIKEVLETLDSYGCGAHHPDLLPLLDQPEQMPIEIEWPMYNESAMACGLPFQRPNCGGAVRSKE
jgi:hypothetical protein